MALTLTNNLPQILAREQADLRRAWFAEHAAATGRRDLASDETLQEHAGEFLGALPEAIQNGGGEDIEGAAWTRVREILADISRVQTKLGLNPSQVATFVFSLKSPLFHALQKQIGKEPELFAKEIWDATLLFDRLGLFTTEVALKAREEIITRQQTEMLELSTPVVKLWDGILALPLIGTLDSERTQIVMENLLQEIVHSGASIAIIDITGVPTVDTLVAQHLLKTVAAARLMGAECIISGIRPQIASTIVHLGVNLGDVATKATLADAFAIALRRSNLAIGKVAAARGAEG